MPVETHIGQYKIVRTLGSGGMGTVYLGEHLLLGRRAAIKTLLPTLSSHREIVERFFNEARAISSISDPGVVQIYDFGYHVDGTAYIVMEYLEGESLAARIDRLGKLPLVDALRIARQIAHSLGAAHARGIVHRDLKPGNVFLIRDAEAQGGERAKILDFGICKLSDESSSSTQNGTMLGTPVYMSPEQCRGNGRVDHRSDIYSVGCALFHMLTGRPPFQCDSVGDFVAAHLKDEPPAPSAFASELPTSVDELVLRCMAKLPAQRYQTMAELQADIEYVLSTLSDRHIVMTAPPFPTTPLGEGFKSAYDVNINNSARTIDQTNDAWFVDSLSPVSASEISDHWEVPKRRMSWLQRGALALALVLGLGGGLAGTSYAMRGEAAKEPPVPATPPVAATEEPALEVPDVASANETLPSEQVAEHEQPTEPEQPAAEQPAQPEQPAAAPVQEAPVVHVKPQRPPRPYVKKPPRPRRVVPLEEPADDLYDTR